MASKVGGFSEIEKRKSRLKGATFESSTAAGAVVAGSGDSERFSSVGGLIVETDGYWATLDFAVKTFK